MRNIKHTIQTKDSIINIMERYPHGVSQKKVISILGLRRSTMLRSWSELKREGILKGIGYGTFILTGKNVTDYSLGTTIDLHALQLVYPIREDRSNDEIWDSIKTDMGWKECTKRLGSITIKKNTKQVQAWLTSQKIHSPEDVAKVSISLAFRIGILLHKLGVDVDMDNVAVKTKHISMKNTELEKMIPKGTKVEIHLGRSVEKVFENDTDEEAKAWIDDTPFKAIETNDIRYARDVLLMPQYIKEANIMISALTQQIKLHLAATQEWKDTAREIRDAIRELSDKK